MPYDLTKYRLRVGDLVEVPRTGSTAHYVDSKLAGKWNFDKGNRGRVVDVWQPHPRENEPPWIVVEPLPEFGCGRHTFDAKIVTKVEDETRQNA